MEIREYPTQDFQALNRASVNDELFDLVVWALIRKTFGRVDLEVLSRGADGTYPLRLCFQGTDGARRGELLLHTVPESKMDREAKDAVLFYAIAPDESAFVARLNGAYISIESEQIAWAELVQEEHGKRWDRRILSLWHADSYSLSLSRAPHCTCLPAPLANAFGPSESLLIEGDSFLTLEAEGKARSPDGSRPRIIWQIIRELTEFIVIRYTSLNRSHPYGSLAATYSWRIAKETVVNLYKKHLSLNPLAIDELLGFFPISDEWFDALGHIPNEPVYGEGRWFVKGRVCDLGELLSSLPKPVEHHEPYEQNASARVHVVSCPNHRGLLTYEVAEQGGDNVWLSVYQSDERFELALARKEHAIESRWPPMGEVQ